MTQEERNAAAWLRLVPMWKAARCRVCCVAVPEGEGYDGAAGLCSRECYEHEQWRMGVDFAEWEDR